MLEVRPKDIHFIRLSADRPAGSYVRQLFSGIGMPNLAQSLQESRPRLMRIGQGELAC